MRAVAQRCQQDVRDIDILARYGGDEFGILLPETSKSGAFEIAQRLRQNVATRPVETSAENFTVTISLGVAARDKETPDLKTLLTRADDALYNAKQAGRNRVCCE
ncbi:MAG: Response regulator PleD [Chloroflexi bacterium]|nr:Response regulator PleD [Chloroflexota bacterium]